ncbi:MAG: hypothetical protein HY300_08395, partial [Verrucomicrobia bacterium]|nr:hypothetical protein [Verrucomicrobiota bacterium]
AVAKSPPDWNILRRLWPNAWKFGLLTVGGWLVANAGLLICSQRLGVRETASFGLTAQVGAFVVGLATLWLTVKWPEIAILRTQGRTVELSTLFARRFACCLGSYLVLASLLLLLGNPFLEWWGAKSRLLPAPQLAFLLFYLAQQMFYVQFEGLAFTENVVPLYGLNLLSGIVMTFAGWALAPGFGVWGVLLAAWLAESAGSAWLFTRRGFQSQTLSPRQFIRVALGGRA